MEIKRISTGDCIPLRSKVLRPFHPLEDCYFPMDSQSVHFGAFSGVELVSIVTAHPEDQRLFPFKGQWRIRGMATDPGKQSSGFGGEVLKALLSWGRSERFPLFWCNAREGAIPFYLRHGFTVQSELFDIPSAGLHKIMKITL